MTRDPMGRILDSVIVAPITSTSRQVSTEVALGAEAGLLQSSVANFDNLLLLDRTQLVRKLGRASLRSMDEACQALAVATGCAG